MSADEALVVKLSFINIIGCKCSNHSVLVRITSEMPRNLLCTVSIDWIRIVYFRYGQFGNSVTDHLYSINLVSS